ncbi:anoctamin-4-like [Amphiura filiformis]|uniref:anoctamin-4-like n=1 Tax=Amphiura filiformis TaxID=82378 RepID=UPI003B20C0F3
MDYLKGMLPASLRRDKPTRASKGAILPDNEDIEMQKTDPDKKKTYVDYVIIVGKNESDDKEKVEKRFKKRTKFQENLKEEGLKLEPEKAQEANDNTMLITVHVPWETMMKYAEILKFKKPIEEQQKDDEGILLKIKGKLKRYDPFHVTISPDTMYATQLFTIERKEEFFSFHYKHNKKLRKLKEKKNSNKEENYQTLIEQTFFTPAERSRVVYEILEQTRYDDGTGDKRFGIDRLISNGSYEAAFPLHEGPYKSEQSMLTLEGRHLNDRHELYEEWARPGRWYKKQPLDAIKNYFGEKIGLYFAWLGFYTEMLTYAAVVGFIVFLYGCFRLAAGEDEVSNDLCAADDPATYTMCPQCSNPRCPYWILSSGCVFARLTFLFDNEATVFFAAFMSLWATTFCEFWKRRQNAIDYKWDLFGFEEQGENIRPAYIKQAGGSKHENPVSKEQEAYISLLWRFPRIMSAILTITFMIALVIAAVLGIIIYRIAVNVAFSTMSDDFVSSQASLFTSITASLISLLIIMILQQVYNRIATKLTEFELHRTDTDYEDSFTFKMYLFAFVNYYSSSFYIAFFKGRLPGTPTDYGKVFGFRQEECDPAGCLQELFINIAIVMCGKQFFNNFMEICVPIVLNYWRARSQGEDKKGKELEQWEEDLILQECDKNGLFSEYLEMAVQFGFTTIFVAAFPLAPFFALINNLMEIRLDAFKYVTQLRRPYAARAQDIGAWYAILVSVGNLAVLTNACVIAFTSEFIPRQVYRYSVGKGSLSGYMNYSLSYFNPDDFEVIDGVQGGPIDDTYPVGDETSQFYNQSVEICRYRGFYTGPDSDEPYEPNRDYWRILALKLVFVLLYEHIIYILKFGLDYIIPDIPAHIDNAIKHENYLAQKALQKQASEHSKGKKSDTE